MNIGDVTQAALLVGAAHFILSLAFGNLRKGPQFKMFLKILGINVACSFVPWLWLGVIMGFPAMLLSALLVTQFLVEKK